MPVRYQAKSYGKSLAYVLLELDYFENVGIAKCSLGRLRGLLLPTSQRCLAFKVLAHAQQEWIAALAHIRSHPVNGSATGILSTKMVWIVPILGATQARLSC